MRSAPLPFLLCVLLQATEPADRLKPLLGIPYRSDGAEDEVGRFVLFSAPGAALPQPGLNCSGFVVAAARRLLGYRGSLRAATQDRESNSGPGAARGEDWDFGRDLILNLSEGRPRRLMFPDGPRPFSAKDRDVRGFPMGSPGIWASLAPRLRNDAVYLGSLSWIKGGRLIHHHVAVILKDTQGRSWFYQTLPKGRVHRLSLDTPDGRTRLETMFGATQHLLLLEVEAG